MSKRININISDDLNNRLDEISSRYGVSKSTICAFATGSFLDSLYRANDVLFDKTDGLYVHLKQIIEKDLKNQ